RDPRARGRRGVRRGHHRVPGRGRAAGEGDRPHRGHRRGAGPLRGTGRDHRRLARRGGWPPRRRPGPEPGRPPHGDDRGRARPRRRRRDGRRGLAGHRDVVPGLRRRPRPPGHVNDGPDGGGARLRVVAIDGPAGAGKSTVARAVAARLGLPVLDTGAIYRAVTFAARRAGVDPQDEEAVARLARTVRLDVGERVLVDGEDATAAIRGPEVTAAVSYVARVPE